MHTLWVVLPIMAVISLEKLVLNLSLTLAELINDSASALKTSCLLYSLARLAMNGGISLDFLL